jgi:hypothetical protein
MFRSKPFPLYDDIMSLIEGRFATGSQAFHVGEQYDGFNTVDEESGSNDDPVPHDSTDQGGTGIGITDRYPVS